MQNVSFIKFKVIRRILIKLSEKLTFPEIFSCLNFQLHNSGTCGAGVCGLFLFLKKHIKTVKTDYLK